MKLYNKIYEELISQSIINIDNIINHQEYQGIYNYLLNNYQQMKYEIIEPIIEQITNYINVMDRNTLYLIENRFDISESGKLYQNKFIEKQFLYLGEIGIKFNNGAYLKKQIAISKRLNNIPDNFTLSEYRLSFLPNEYITQNDFKIKLKLDERILIDLFTQIQKTLTTMINNQLRINGNE